MEMRASENVEIGQDLTPPLSPLAFSLYDTFLLSHCSSCFSPLLPTASPSAHHAPSPLYCSPRCSADASGHLQFSAERQLFLRPELATRYDDDASDLRVALRLLRFFESFSLPLLSDRIGGILTNHDEFFSRRNLDGDEMVARIAEGAQVMAKARSIEYGIEFPGHTTLEEAVLCLVLTNAVEVQDKNGRSLGIAVYDTNFSWINHSCSPNACYRFLTSQPEKEAEPPMQQLVGCRRLLIIPGSHGVEGAVLSCGDLRKACKGYGPKIVVRSIRPIKKEEEVTVAYTDLLQPKEMRLSELWLKYRFTCYCGRCNALPPTHLDNALQDIAATCLECTNVGSDYELFGDKAIGELSEFVDDTITDYLSVGDSESCCEKLENILTQCVLIEDLESSRGKLHLNSRLHPLHYVSLNVYTTLACAYKVRAGRLQGLHPATHEHQLKAFSMSRSSTAYSLLLAGATHHRFLAEPSLIVSVANFWTNAGESLLSFSRSSLWNLFIKSHSSLPGHNCCNCSLMGQFEESLLFSEARKAYFENISRDFINCIINTMPKIWSFLTNGCHYLELFKDPIDFSWLTESADLWNHQACLNIGTGGRTHSCEAKGYWDQVRINLFHVGVHCLLYGCYLLSICYDHHSYRSRYVRHLIYGEENRNG